MSAALPEVILHVEESPQQSELVGGVVAALNEVVTIHNKVIDDTSKFLYRVTRLYPVETHVVENVSWNVGGREVRSFVKVIRTPAIGSGDSEKIVVLPIVEMTVLQPDVDEKAKLLLVREKVVVHPSGLMYAIGYKNHWMKHLSLSVMHGDKNHLGKRYEFGVDGNAGVSYDLKNSAKYLQPDGATIQFEHVEATVGSDLQVWKMIAEGLRVAYSETDLLSG